MSVKRVSHVLKRGRGTKKKFFGPRRKQWPLSSTIFTNSYLRASDVAETGNNDKSQGERKKKSSKKKVFSTFLSHFSTDSVHFESYRYVSTTATSVLTGTPRQRLRTRRVLRSIRPDSVLKVFANGTLRHWKKNFRAHARTRPFVPRP